MSSTKPKHDFLPVQIAVLTVSDTRTLENDTSGDLLVERLTEAGHRLAARALLRDDTAAVRAQVEAWIADPNVDAVISTGGTGLTGRDVTVEAVEPLYEKKIDGFGELFRMLSYKTIGTSTIQSRATAGLIGTTFVFCLPGSRGACRDAWEGILRHQFDNRHKPCNFIEVMPRLSER